MVDVFAFKTGKFTPLAPNVLAKFSDEQRAAYFDLKLAVAQLDICNAEVEATNAVNRSAVDLLRAAEVAEAARPKWTFLDELRASQAQWRADHT